jgi:hypothetical protein
MILEHVWGLFSHPKEEWESIRHSHCTVGRCYAVHVLLLAAIPAVAGYVGTTQVGWTIGAGDPVKLATDSAGPISALFYLCMLVGVYSIGMMIHWMGQTYGANPVRSQCVILAAYTATPLFLIGITGFFPILWLMLILGLPALAYTVFLLYTGLPIMMDIDPERGFLFSSAVLGVGLVALVALLAATALLWGMGLEPQFTR